MALIQPRRRGDACIALMVVLLLASVSGAAAGESMGPLVVCPTNPRYFQNSATGEVVYLTGSHTWNSLVDIGKADPPAPFDFEAYLDFLQRYGHNFIRLWTWESVTWDSRTNGAFGK